MDDLKWELLAEIQGRSEAEIIESLLESQGIDVELFQEAIGHQIYPVTINGLGRVQIFVPKNKVKRAKQWLNIYQKGKTEN